MENTKADPTAPSLVLERVYAAPCQLVYDAWTKHEHLIQWLAPDGFTIPEARGELREGGEWFTLMIAPNGEKYPVSGTYLEIVPNKLLVMSHGWIEDDGRRPHETILKVSFSDVGKETKVRLEQTGFKSVESRDGHNGGWSQCLGKLATFIDNTSFALDASDCELVITRIVNAPRELVWHAMTKPEHVVNWWGPNGFTTKIEEMDVRVGGTWSHVMRGPDGTEYPNKSVFTEVVRPERIVFSHSGGRKGETTSAVMKEMEWTFEAIDENKTRVTIHQTYPSAEMRDKVVREYGALEGGKQCLARLGVFVETSGEPGFEISRTFAAPRDLVWKAWTDPKQMAQWWGPTGFTNPVCELDVRVGGAYRITMRSPDGNEYPLLGVFREVVPSQKLVYTMDVSGHPEEFHDMVNPGRDKSQKPKLTMIQMATFEDAGAGKTKLTIRAWFSSEAIRDAMLKMGMHGGWSCSLDRLEELVAK